MLNATMCATTRTICVILENYSCLCMNVVITGGVCTYVKCYNVCYNQNYMCDLGELFLSLYECRYYRLSMYIC